MITLLVLHRLRLHVERVEGDTLSFLEDRSLIHAGRTEEVIDVVAVEVEAELPGSSTLSVTSFYVLEIGFGDIGIEVELRNVFTEV